jgi:hypothetical protein
VGVAPLTNGGDGEWLQVQAKHFIMASVIMGSAGQGRAGQGKKKKYSGQEIQSCDRSRAAAKLWRRTREVNTSLLA